MVKETIAFIFIVIFLSALCIVPLIADVTDYRYYSRVDIQNEGSTDVTGRLTFTINTESLGDAGYVQPDFEDVILSSGSVEENILLTNTSSPSAIWRTDTTTIPANGIITKTLWMGNSSATRNQEWIADEDDSVYVEDATSLDITTNLTVEGTFKLSATPSVSKHLISKTGNYQLFATKIIGTPLWGFTVFKLNTSGTTTTINPNGDSTPLELTPSTGTTHYTLVSDSSDATYNYTLSTAYKEDSYDMDISPIQTYSDINSVTVHWRYRTSHTATATYSKPVLRLGSDSTIGAEKSDLSGNWQNESEALTRPGGGSWSWEDLAYLQIGIQLKTTGGVYSCDCAEVYAVINYDILDDYNVITVATVRTQETVKGTYDGSYIRLYVDGQLKTTGTVSGSLNTNSGRMYLADFDGLCDNLRVGDTNVGTPTWQAIYTFEPDEISGSTIEDTSSNTNTATYTFADNPDDITVTVGKVTPYILAYYTGGGISGEDPEGIPIDLPDEPDSAYDDAGFDVIPGATFINEHLDTAEIPRALFWYTAMLLLAIGIGLFSFDKIRDIVAVAIASIAALLIAAATDMGIGFLDILSFAIVMVALFVRREHSTGRL